MSVCCEPQSLITSKPCLHDLAACSRFLLPALARLQDHHDYWSRSYVHNTAPPPSFQTYLITPAHTQREYEEVAVHRQGRGRHQAEVTKVRNSMARSHEVSMEGRLRMRSSTGNGEIITSAREYSLGSMLSNDFTYVTTASPLR